MLFNRVTTSHVWLTKFKLKKKIQYLSHISHISSIKQHMWLVATVVPDSTNYRVSSSPLEVLLKSGDPDNAEKQLAMFCLLKGIFYIFRVSFLYYFCILHYKKHFCLDQITFTKLNNS